MSNLQLKQQTDTWVAASWDEYIQTIEDSAYETARGYYYQGHMRIEMLPVGHDHSEDDGTISLAANLFGIAKAIPLKILPNCSYRKVGVGECQPDGSYYIGDRAQLIPRGTSVIDLNRFPPPDLVIEVASTTLLDDIGIKRTLYEDLGVAEYWVLDVKQAQVLAFTVAERGSKRIQASQVLPGLTISVLEEALRRSRETNQSQVGAWLLSQFQS
ncbi:MAG: Uma2 family endonuclease [Leptolyngbyaceae cyanobacterium RM2_2_4]|nr:Uma2 family endonuclease [Leptolyngbyaceae cyanobacterium SM1_4_3]NJN90760.1 Uma2 family endonuclease [Leptolyngbyaceae cyanobacterium SL_5_14]NJO50430.1 Uma2 family endonuclease [Leptolyngbyaceae cyanobacterium RM2_2_4]